MIRTLLNKVANWLVKKTSVVETKPVDNRPYMDKVLDNTVADRRIVTVEKKVNSFERFNDMDWKTLTNFHKEVIDNWTAEIQAEIQAKGYKEIPSILSQYRTEMIQHFVMLQKISLGDYDSERDNLDSLTREKLIVMSLQLNQLQFEKRMIETGKAEVTAKQKEQLAKFNLPVPSNKFEASRMIDKALRDSGVDTSKPYSNLASEAQKNRIANMAQLLNKAELAVTETMTKKQASDMINSLQTEIDNNPEFNKGISQKQFETIEKILKQLNKRMTTQRKEKYLAMSSSEASKEIRELSAEYNKLHPELSDGQLQYIIQLCTTLNVPYSIESIKLLTKIEATAKIDELSREYLFVLTRKTNPDTTKETIKKMSSELVKKLTKQIREEGSLRDYKEFEDR